MLVLQIALGIVLAVVLLAFIAFLLPLLPAVLRAFEKLLLALAVLGFCGFLLFAFFKAWSERWPEVVGAMTVILGVIAGAIWEERRLGNSERDTSQESIRGCLMRALVPFLLLLCLSLSEEALAKGHHRGRSAAGASKPKNYCIDCPRDSRGRIKRNPSAKRKFKEMTGYPKGRPGYIVDHIIPLKRGGADSPDNMQWQTKEEARIKDQTE